MLIMPGSRVRVPPFPPACQRRAGGGAGSGRFAENSGETALPAQPIRSFSTKRPGKRPADHEMTQPLPAFHCCAIFSPLASDRNAGIAKVLISSTILLNPSMSSSSPIFLTKAFH